MNSQGYTWRVVIISVVMLAVLIGLGARLAFLHLGPNDDLRRRVEKIRHTEREILVGRGRILDRNENILALDLPVKDVCADPAKIKKQNQVSFIAAHLARVLQLDVAMIQAKLMRSEKQFMYVDRFVEKDITDQISRMKLPGVFFEDASARNYPQKELMCHVVGFSNWEGVGSAGVEQHMNRYLKGRPGLRISELDGRRREVYGRRSMDIAPQQGADVYLTLDQNVQFMVEQALEKAMEEHSAKGAWAIVQKVRTGEILAMAGRPGFDLNEFRSAEDEARRNRIISYVYEPGSTFKVAVIAAALNEKVVQADQMIDCEGGTWYYNRRPLRDYHAYDKLSVQDVLKKSSNIGAAKIALALGDQRLEEYMRAFGFGRPLGIELPGEESGIFHGRSVWSNISATRIAMGHEIAVTALQMLNAVCAIANDGYLMKPRVVKKIVDPQGRIILESEPKTLSRPITAEASALMRQMMARVTEPGGTGRRARIEGYTVAGKTGTAQKPVPGGYSDSANMASFVGFLPAEAPEIGIIVVVDEPQPLHTGGQVAAPVFREIAEEAVRYLDLPPPVRGEVALNKRSAKPQGGSRH